MGNATDFGDLTGGNYRAAALANATRGLVLGGHISGSPIIYIDYFTIASAGNATDFGDLTAASDNLSGGVASATRGVVGFVADNNTMEYVTIDSAGNDTDFGDLTAANGLGSGTSDYNV